MTQPSMPSRRHQQRISSPSRPCLYLGITTILIVIAALQLVAREQENPSSKTKFDQNYERLNAWESKQQSKQELPIVDKGSKDEESEKSIIVKTSETSKARNSEDDAPETEELAIVQDHRQHTSDGNTIITSANETLTIQQTISAKRLGRSRVPRSGVVLGPLPRDIQPAVKRWNSVALDTCLTQGEPDEPSETWQKRAPHFLLLGHHKSGTQALTQYLWQHPDIAQNRLEMHFFNGKTPLRFTSSEGIQRKSGRNLYQTALMHKISSNSTVPFRSEKSNMITFDSTPRYFLDADRNPQMIMCLVPWVKLVVLFRNPVERVLSHYNYLNQARQRNNKRMVDWRDWINDDLKSLGAAGIIDASRTVKEQKAFAGSKEEAQAWATYTRSRNSQFLLGRGLYAIQLRQWFRAMDKIGKSRNDLHVIQSEKLKTNTRGEYSKLVQFLGLKDHNLTYSGSYHETRDVDYQHVPMPDDIRRELEEFFAPYNKEVHELLGEEWDATWNFS